MPLTAQQQQRRDVLDAADQSFDAFLAMVLGWFSAAQKAARQADIIAPLSIEAEQQVVSTLVAALPEPDIVATKAAISSAVAAGARTGFDHIPTTAIIKADLEIDLFTPQVSGFITKHAAELVVAVSETTVAGIREVVRYTFERRLHVKVAAKRIRQMVGMTPQAVRANIRLRDRLVEAGVNSAKVEKTVAAHAKRSIRRRAETIARTESVTAVGFGRQQAWEQAAQRGILDTKRVQKQWLTARDERVDCCICAPMDGQRRDIHQPFTTGEGVSVMAPGMAVHPNDRCTVIIIPKPRR